MASRSVSVSFESCGGAGGLAEAPGVLRVRRSRGRRPSARGHSKSSYARCNSPVLQRLVELALFSSRRFVRALSRHGMASSIGRVGAAGDSAAMESFFSLLQKNVLDRRNWSTREELRLAIVAWIERTCH